MQFTGKSFFLNVKLGREDMKRDFLFFFLCFSYIQQVSATACSRSFLPKKILRMPIYSSLSNESMLQITGLKPRDFSGLVVLEVASGKNLFMNYAIENGARAALAVDRRVWLWNKKLPKERYLRADILNSNTVEQIRKRLGGLADITIVASIFGVLNEQETVEWLEQLIQFTKPEGFIIVDFMISDEYRRNGGISENEFKDILNDIEKNKRLINSFSNLHKNKDLKYEKMNPLAFWPNSIKALSFEQAKERPPSVTYRIDL